MDEVTDLMNLVIYGKDRIRTKDVTKEYPDLIGGDEVIPLEKRYKDFRFVISLWRDKTYYNHYNYSILKTAICIHLWDIKNKWYIDTIKLAREKGYLNEKEIKIIKRILNTKAKRLILLDSL